MDNEDVIADLKQFIAASITQQTHDLVAGMDDMGGRIDQMSDRIDQMSGRMATKDDLEAVKNEILEAIGETMTANTEATDEQLADHERRITTLEAKAA